MRAALLLVLLAGCMPRVRPMDPVQWNAAARDCQRGAQDACFWIGTTRQWAGDLAGAHALFEKACEADVPDACAVLAGNLLDGRGVTQNAEQGVVLAQRACEAGSAFGCHRLGLAYLRGEGVPKQPARSTPFFAWGCSVGDPESCRDFGVSLAEGRSAPPDVPRARALWRKACPDDDLSCTALADSLKPEDAASALEIAREGCREGGAASCHWVGTWYDELKQFELATRYFRASCAWRHAESCLALGEELNKVSPPRIQEANLVWNEGCRGGNRRACERLCIEAMSDLESPGCKSACALGSKDSCPGAVK